jgi:hypothetical protein
MQPDRVIRPGISRLYCTVFLRTGVKPITYHL